MSGTSLAWTRLLMPTFMALGFGYDSGTGCVRGGGGGGRLGLGSAHPLSCKPGGSTLPLYIYRQSDYVLLPFCKSGDTTSRDRQGTPRYYPLVFIPPPRTGKQRDARTRELGWERGRAGEGGRKRRFPSGAMDQPLPVGKARPTPAGPESPRAGTTDEALVAQRTPRSPPVVVCAGSRRKRAVSAARSRPPGAEPTGPDSSSATWPRARCVGRRASARA